MTKPDPDQAAARRFVTEILRITGWTATELARRAGVSPSTLTRFLGCDVTHTLSARTISKIKRAAMPEIPINQLDALWLTSQREPPANGRDGNTTQR